MKKQIFKIIFIATLFLTARSIVFAADVNLTIRDGVNVIFTGIVSLPTSVTSLNDKDGVNHTVNENSTLAVLAKADEVNDNFSISNLTYFSSFDSLYLKCITNANGEKCDNWQYAVNDNYPSDGIDKKILSGGENVYIYFGPQNKIILSSNSIMTNEALTVTAHKYDYQNDSWAIRTGVTVGLTQPDPNNTFSPIEIKTGTVDTNGQAVFSSIPSGSYNAGVKEDYYFPTEILVVTEAPITPISRGGGGGGGLITTTTPLIIPKAKAKFDLEKAFEFLFSQQKENGSFGENLYTDWTALALASYGNKDSILKLIKYFEENKLEKPLLTDYERQAIALMALGLNPYNINGENYIEKIVTSFDGKQFGDINEDNDDIFALIVLQNAGYKQDDKMINSDISFILNKQKENGSWDSNVDITGATIEALSVFNQNEQIKNVLSKAKDFLKQNQKEDGGFGNASSTAWALEGIIALDEKPEDWIKNNNTPLDYFGSIQDVDGGIKNENIKNKIWETAYVVSTLSGKTWNQIMQKFEKPKIAIATKIPNPVSRKQQIKKNMTQNITRELTTAAINAINKSSAETKTETRKKNWLARFLDIIFGSF